MAESVFGFVGDGYTLLASDTAQARSILVYKHDEDKFTKLNDKCMCVTAGEHGSRIQFTEYIQKNITLQELRTDTPLDTHSIAHYVRRELATALRKNPYNVNLLIGGHDEDAGPSLYFMDYLSAMQKMNFATHGYAGYFCYSLLDRHWKPKMSIDEGKELIAKCINELHTRFMLNQPKFLVKIVDKDGVRELDISEALARIKPVDPGVHPGSSVAVAAAAAAAAGAGSA